MAKLPRSPRRSAALLTTALCLTTAAMIAAFAPASALAAPASASPMMAAPAVPPALGTIGSYSLIKLTITLAESAYTTKWGTHVAARNLLTVLRYPVLSAGSPAEEFPLIVFAPGNAQCDSPNYVTLLRSIASAGYVVAAVNFPRTDCKVAKAQRGDITIEPHDLSSAITALLKLSGATTGPLSGLIDPKHIGAMGHSDGAVVVGILADDSCCHDARIGAVAMDSGAFWTTPGYYYATWPTPVLFEHGSRDTTNPPINSLRMFNSDLSKQKYFLALLQGTHTTPVWGSNPTEQLNALITTEYFDKYLLGQATDAHMKKDGNKAGIATLTVG